MAPQTAHNLSRYRKKRDFSRTPEPSGARRRSRRRLQFVIQRHHARRLHYDLRLEWGGVLKSWAVPKGPSLDPSEKRLAVQVEDHPFEYRNFTGEIPAGEYGAGQVTLWDRGTYVPTGDVDRALASGKLEFTLKGQRLQGAFLLVRIRGEQKKPTWLLIKKRDEHAVIQGGSAEITKVHAEPLETRSARRGARQQGRKLARNVGVAARRAVSGTAHPSSIRFIPPQLASMTDKLPEQGQWLTELKFDGYRILTHADGSFVQCFSRNGLAWTHRIPAVAAELGRLQLKDAWLDGELIAVNERGIPEFQRMQRALDPASGVVPIYMVFDLLGFMGADLRARPLLERKRLLQQAFSSLEHRGPVRLVEYVDGASLNLRDRACAQGFEGVILKDAGAPYRSGRTRAWLKLKCRHEQEFVIGGYTRTAKGRDTLTSILLGYYDAQGRLLFAGRAGTGFSEELLASLRKRLDELAREQSPFSGLARLRSSEKVRWVQPGLVAQVRFTEWTDSGLLRQPLFLGLREDADPAAVRREPAPLLPPARKRLSQGKLGVAPANQPSARGTGTESRGKPRRRPFALRLTHPQRALYPLDGVTKRQLAEYYESIAPLLWKHLQDRPLSIVRATGSPGHTFFYRHLGARPMPGLVPVEIPAADPEPYFACASESAIPHLAQLGGVELHTWGTRQPRPELPDRVTFDLDPDPQLSWTRVAEAATLVRDLLAELGLAALLKTTGGHGLHVVVPLKRGPSAQKVAAFAKRVAEHLASRIPERFSSVRGAPNRKGRVYVDWQRNQLGATTVSAYSPRHRPGVPVSVPLAWDELGVTDLRGAHFNLRNVLARVAERGDPWEQAAPIHQSLSQRAVDRLEAAAGRMP